MWVVTSHKEKQEGDVCFVMRSSRKLLLLKFFYFFQTLQNSFSVSTLLILFYFVAIF